MNEETIFDKIIRKEIPANIVFEDGDVVAFHDINPEAPVHVLVVPKHKVASYDKLVDVPSDVVGRFFLGVAKVAKSLNLETDGYRVVLNCGKSGQQTVKYLHAHILGGRQMSWPPG
jgi:histidine triad (HIT) family protein